MPVFAIILLISQAAFNASKTLRDFLPSCLLALYCLYLLTHLQVAYNAIETPMRAGIYKALMGKTGAVRAGGAASMLAEQQRLAQQPELDPAAQQPPGTSAAAPLLPTQPPIQSINVRQTAG